MSNLIEKIRKEKIELENKYSKQLQGAIVEQLDLLQGDIKFGPEALCNEYGDHINHINKDGSLIIYNNSDCCSSGIAHDDANVANSSWNTENQMDILSILINHNKDNVKPELKTFRVQSECINYCYIDVEAVSKEEANQIAEGIDGGDFTSTEDGAWNILNDLTAESE